MAPGSSREDWAVYKAGEVAPTCECCAVLLNKAPGELCHIVPVWELKDWECPGCTPAVETSSLCNRVVYNFKAISSTDPSFNPSQWREYSSAPGVGFEYKHTLPGQSGQDGILRGYYRDPECELKPSPGNFIGQASTNTAIYDLQLDPYPPPAPPTPPPVEAGWGNCCDRYGCLQAVETYTGAPGTSDCKGCSKCAKLGSVALGCAEGTQCQALCHKHWKLDDNGDAESCSWDSSENKCKAEKKWKKCPSAPPAPGLLPPPPPPSPPPVFSEVYCPGGVYRCCVVLYKAGATCGPVPVWDFAVFDPSKCTGSVDPRTLCHTVQYNWQSKSPNYDPEDVTQLEELQNSQLENCGAKRIVVNDRSLTTFGQPVVWPGVGGCSPPPIPSPPP